MERLPVILVALMVIGGMHGNLTPQPSLQGMGMVRTATAKPNPSTPSPRDGEGKKGNAATARARVPGDRLQEHCVNVINGTWGTQPAWKVQAAWYVLGRSVTVQGRAKVTTYCDKCDSSGCGSDGGCLADGVVAANPEVNGHQVVWTEAYGFGIVCDRGGAVKLGEYVRAGESANIDTYMRDGCVGDCWTGPGTRRQQAYAIIGDVEAVIGETAEGEWRRRQCCTR